MPEDIKTRPANCQTLHDLQPCLVSAPSDYPIHIHLHHPDHTAAYNIIYSRTLSRSLTFT